MNCWVEFCVVSFIDVEMDFFVGLNQCEINGY